MKSRILIYPLILTVLVLFTIEHCDAQKSDKPKSSKADPLPSWNETKTKKAIITFVEMVTKEDSPGFVPKNERIATFDNDGTLWSEQPIYFQTYFAFDIIKAQASQHPEWTKNEPYASALKGDINALLTGNGSWLIELCIFTHLGLTTDEFNKAVSDWFSKAKHPTTKKLFTEMIYQPMVELLDYLRANGFKTYIVSGGDIDFMRSYTEKAYGIPPEQVIGSSVKTKFEYKNDTPTITGQAGLNILDDAEGKALEIQSVIGRRPIFSCGNSDGDIQMMQWTTAGNKSHFCLYVHHTDSIREWAYDRKSVVGTLDKGLDQAVQKGWNIIDMKNDWKIIYPFEKK